MAVAATFGALSTRDAEWVVSLAGLTLGVGSGVRFLGGCGLVTLWWLSLRWWWCGLIGYSEVLLSLLVVVVVGFRRVSGFG